MWALPVLPLSPLIYFVLSEQLLPLLSFNFPSSLPVLSYPLSLSSSCFLYTRLPPPCLPASTLHQGWVMLLLGSRRAASLSSWHRESFFLTMTSFTSGQRRYLPIMLGGNSCLGIWWTKCCLSWDLGKADGHLRDSMNCLACLKC